MREDPPSERQIRIAAVGDHHFDLERGAELRGSFAGLHGQADVLVLCGDLTTHGRAEQMRGFVDLLADVDVPIVAVLGNHDFEAGCVDEVVAILRERGVHVLDGDNVEIAGIGFAGVKGFGGGFGRGALGPFGEVEYKQFVQRALDEALKLENALRTLRTETRVAVLHYAPIADTLAGEPEMIWPFLGSSRLLPPIETYGASVVFHGHAHTGVPDGRTPSGIPVHNVALPLLRTQGRHFRIWTAPAPDRRGRTPAAGAGTVSGET
jgi:Icc-related predicted phosphoesterase